VGVAAGMLGVASVGFAKLPAVGCGATIPVVTRPAWRLAARELVPVGAVEVRLCRANGQGVITTAAGPTPAQVRELAAGFDALPAGAGAAPGCVRHRVPRLLARFGYA
jgi:hypothetical protein